MGTPSDVASNGGSQMGNFGGNRMPSYGESRQQSGQPAAGMNHMPDFAGQTMVIRDGLKNKRTGVGVRKGNER